MIPLQNLAQQHLGFLLTAGLPDDFVSTIGRWEGEGIFVAVPTEAELFEDPAYQILAAHRDAGEHRLVVANDGVTIEVIATSPDGMEVFVRLPDSAAGVWGTRDGAAEIPMGHAVKVAKRS